MPYCYTFFSFFSFLLFNYHCHFLQPCKKSRKDGSSPVVKTITNYFSPVAKDVEKPFSPPRSNNIMDYFSRKGPSSKEKTSPPQQVKENCLTSQSTEKHPSPEAAVKRQTQRRGRKASKAARKLVEVETVSCTEEECCLIVGEQTKDKDSAEEVTRTCGVPGNSTASLLDQFSADASERNSNVELFEKNQCHEGDLKCENDVKNKPELKSVPSSSAIFSSDKAKKVKTVAQNSSKKQDQDENQPEADKNESLCDVSMGKNMDEASQLNHSTVTISFEDFVQSQNQGKGKKDVEDEIKITTAGEKIDIDQLDKNADLEEQSLHVSPRTLTVKAEIHIVSDKPEAGKAVGKLASIFNRRKGMNSSAELASSPPSDAGPQLPSTSQTVKRKSNVVLQEEDLELAVLESESTPKCSEAERKQFMSAFKQPSLDGTKTKPTKSQGKQKQPEEKDLDAAGSIVKEATAVQVSVDEAPAPSLDNDATKKKAARKGRKKAKEEEKAKTTSPAPVVEPVITIDDKKEEPPVTSGSTIPPVRRSKRETVVRQEPETTPTTPVRRTRKQHNSKDAAAALPDSPEKASAPRIRKSKHGVFAAEMLCPPDTKESPIRCL